MHLTCCEITRIKLESISRLARSTYCQRPTRLVRTGRGVPVVDDSRSYHPSSNLVRRRLNAIAERALYRLSRMLPKKRRKSSESSSNSKKIAWRFLRLPLKPFENYVPEFAPWPERFAACGLLSKMSGNPEGFNFQPGVNHYCRRCLDCYIKPIRFVQPISDYL
jgi:hypothetical protein